jgi:hypothetical protein
MKWQEAPELAQVIEAWFHFPQPVVAKILTIVRT